MSRAGMGERAASVIDAYLAHDVNLTGPGYESRRTRCLMDILLQGDRKHEVSRLVVQALRQSLETTGVAYEPNVPNFIHARCAQEGQGRDDVGITATACRHLKTVHRFVQDRVAEVLTEQPGSVFATSRKSGHLPIEPPREGSRCGRGEANRDTNVC